MLDMGTLQAHIELEGAEEFKNSLEEAAESTEELGEEAEDTSKSLKDKLLDSALKVGAGFSMLASAAKDIGQRLKGLLDDTAAYGDEVDKNSQKMGVSASEYQKWDYVLQRNGSSIDTLERGMKTLNGNIASGSDAFDKLGVSLTNSDGSLRSSEEIMNDTMTALAGMEDGAERTALASELFGSKVAAELNPTLNSGADGIQELKDRADELGLVLSDEGVSASAEYQDAMLDLQETLGGVKNKIGSSLLPIVTDLVNKVTNEVIPAIKDFIKNNEWLIPAIAGVTAALVSFKAAMGISMIIQGAVGAYNAFKAANEGATIAQWLLNAAMNANPIVLIVTLIAGLVAAIGVLWATNDDFRQACSDAWNAVCEVVSGVVQALVEFFTVTIPTGLMTAIDWFAQLPGNILSAIGSLATTLVEKAAELITGFLDGIKQWWENVTSWLGDIPSKVLSAVGDLSSTLWDAGVSIISGFFGGLKEKWEGVKSWFGGIGTWIANNKGPREYDLKLLVPNGGWIMQGLMAGLEKAKPELEETLQGIADTVSGTKFNAFADVDYSASGSGALALAGAGTNYNIYINGTRINDDAQIENKFAELIKLMARKGMM